MTELAPDPDVVAQGSEREQLLSFLEFYRSVFLRKTEGISDIDGRRRLEPGIMTLTGLLRHMAEVERGWFRRRLADDAEAGPLFYSDEDPDGDFRVTETDTIAAARRALDSEIEIARANVAATPSFDTLATGTSAQRPGWQPNLRWIVIHMIEEYARHCGHADLLRERIDGTTGD